MDQVNFTRMDEGTAEEYELVERLYHDHKRDHLVDHLLGQLKLMQGPKLGYLVDRYEHSLQSATRALREGAEEEMVVAALLHDVGDVIAPDNHSAVAAAILQPYVSERTHWVILHHGLFQGYYYWHHLGQDRNARDRYKGHEHFEACADFCERWDQMSFDPNYDTEPMKTFEPMVRRLFAREPVYGA